MEKLAVGKINRLEVIKQLDFGIYLDGLDMGEILMPKQYVPENTKPGDTIEAFIYFDSEDRIIATSIIPYALAGEFASLKAVSVSQSGAFLDWGLPKDLFVPFREQKMDMKEGSYYVVYVYLDQVSHRMVASTRIEKFLSEEKPVYENGEAVTILVYQKTDIGYKAIINQKHMGVIHFSDVFKKLEYGGEMLAYVRKLKEDGKIDLVLQKPGYESIDPISVSILDRLKKNNGFLPLNDKSSSEQINTELGLSKKTFKKALGALYKDRKIVFEPNGIRLTSP
ncbi:MAG: GntR family transcriptional regulator [Flavobacteriales bacterium]|nr:GntR family transcriptional regulator [Flavobacteriales bacterium]